MKLHLKLDLQLHINRQFIKLINLAGGYRSWTIEYSYGLQAKIDGDWKNLWHWPTFRHLDLNQLLDKIDISVAST